VMSPVTLECRAYLFDAAKGAFVLSEGNAVLPAYQACILADEATYASVTELVLTGVTGIEAIGNADGKEVESVKYYTVGGVELAAPAQGQINIKVITYVDGTTETVKAYVK
ncbi:MAG: hypothetical protein IJ467_08355, partial [Bacteroidaceae bacterium]|nr:hypothetical protein [Bacteroidaceae bacterium]MBQ8594270.1 hypothetical protein [Bacteroidaceae bacterium]